MVNKVHIRSYIYRCLYMNYGQTKSECFFPKHNTLHNVKYAQKVGREEIRYRFWQDYILICPFLAVIYSLYRGVTVIKLYVMFTL